MTNIYFFVGYPGAGKTTLAKMIAHATGAAHLWADRERKKLYGDPPTYSESESADLYQKLNATAEYLLKGGRSVVYDTNFNYRADRDLIRAMAKKHDAEAVLIWVTTPKQLAEDRAVQGSAGTTNRVLGTMSAQEFEANACKLEQPEKDENFIKIDGTKLDESEVVRQLGW